MAKNSIIYHLLLLFLLMITLLVALFIMASQEVVSSDTIVTLSTVQAKEETLPEQLPSDSNYYKLASNKYDVPWEIILEIHKVEHSRYMDSPKSYAGARGCMQFMPTTFYGKDIWNSWEKKMVHLKGYGVDGNGDDVADIHNCIDSIFSDANYLQENQNKTGSWWWTIGAYNCNKDWYIKKVLRGRLL